MQTLDRLPAAPPAGNAVTPPSEKNCAPSSPDDFSRMMQQALAAKPKESPRETGPRLETAATEKSSSNQEADPAVLPANKNAAKAVAAEAGGKFEKAAAKTSADQPAGNADLTVSPTLDFITVPVLPLPAVFFPVGASTEIKAVTENHSAPSLLTTIDNTGGGTAPVEKTKLPVPDLSPTKPATGALVKKTEPDKKPAAAAAGATLKNATAAADKNLASAEAVQPAANADPVQKNSELAAGLVPVAENDGTGVAMMDSSMKKSANTNKVAGLDGTVLPGEGSLTALEKVLPTSAVAGPVRAVEGNSAAASFNLPTTSAPAAADFSNTQAVAVVPAFMEARLRNLERTHDMVALHAVRLVEGQTDSLSVVIKPGAGTELSLQLRQRDGGVEAHAVLQRGDFQLMNQHWPELQQRLEQRGIKLAPLGSETNFLTDSGSGFKQQQQASQEAEAQKASAFAEFALAGRALGATARLAVGVSGWESWA
jgi:hypothetical protein